MKEVYIEKKNVSFWSNKKFLTLLMGLFIISIMVFSVLYYGLDSSGQEKVEYQGITFTQTNYGWQGYTDEDERILILTNPQELEGVPLPSGISFSYLEHLPKVYVSFNPENDMSSVLQDFQANVRASGYLTAACYEDSELCSELPIKTCVDASESVGVVLFQYAEEDSVTLEGNCLTIQGKNLLMLTDKLILDSYV